MTKGPDSVWYAAYGSNLHYDRLKHYLRGGKYRMTGVTHHGSSDPSEVVDFASDRIDRAIYFSGNSTSWQEGGISFLDVDSQIIADQEGAYIRYYRISKQQFQDIFFQENAKDPHEGYPPIDFDTLIDQGSLNYGPADDFVDYGRLVYLGPRDGYPVLTFTSKRTKAENGISSPGEKYLFVIAAGLREGHELSEEDIVKYFLSIKSIEGKYDKQNLLTIVQYLCIDKTEERKNTQGWFVVTMNSEVLQSRGLKKKNIILLTNSIANETLKIHCKIGIDDTSGTTTLRMDQKLRASLFLEPGHLIGNIDREHILKRAWYREKIASMFGLQRNIARISMTNFENMEINLCRLPMQFMETIGVNSGDFVVLEAPSSDGKSLTRLPIRALIMDNEHKGKGIVTPNKKNKKEYFESIKKLIAKNEHIQDIPLICIDEYTRLKLGVEVGAPVYVYRSFRHAVRSQLEKVSTPLALALMGGLISMNHQTRDNLVLNIIVVIVTICLIIFLHLRSLKQEV